jgi:predicted transcriptional regulator
MSTTELTATIVASYVERNRLAPAEIEPLIRSVYAALAMLGQGPAVPEAEEKPTATQIKRSIRQDALVSFIDGRPYKLLKRHLNAHGLTPAEYRARFGLPTDYPMTAPDYTAKRSSSPRPSASASRRGASVDPRGVTWSGFTRSAARGQRQWTKPLPRQVRAAATPG